MASQIQPTVCFGKQKFYWNTAPLVHFTYSLRLLAHETAELIVVTKSIWLAKPKIFTIWPLRGKGLLIPEITCIWIYEEG